MSEVSTVARIAGCQVSGEDLARLGLEHSQLSWRGSHCNVSLGTAQSTADAVRAARRFIASTEELRDLLRTSGAAISIDFGLMVGSANSFAPSIELDTQALAEFAAAGIDVVVSAYPAGDE
jgi:hypothetical protein